MKKLIAVFILIGATTFAQRRGCTDVKAQNYNLYATENDGSCVYKNPKIKIDKSLKIDPVLLETSGLIAFDNLLWTHNDDHDTHLYGLDSLGIIQKKIKLDNVVNTDWEEISQDSTHIYIGDFGNNYQGNRTDLKLLRIEKKSFLTGKPIIDNISFSYANQTDFSKQKGNITNFDCEAFVVARDSIYLFTKQWIDNKSAVYVLPNLPGNHIAKYKTTLEVNGLVTGATMTANNQIVLCGYTKTFKTFLYLITDLQKFNFQKANQRRLLLSLTFHQIEGITTFDGSTFYISNESFSKKPLINNPQKLHTIKLADYLEK